MHFLHVEVFPEPKLQNFKPQKWEVGAWNYVIFDPFFFFQTTKVNREEKKDKLI